MNTKDKARDLQVKVEAALKSVFGDDFRMDGGSIDATSVTLRVRFPLATGADATASLREQFNAIAPAFGLRSEDFDLPIQLNGGRAVTLTEIHANRGKFPFVVKRDDGKLFKVGPDTFIVARHRASAKRAA